MIAAMIKSAIVLALAACVASTMRKQSAAVRHAIWTAGLLGALAIPVCTLALPSWRTDAGARIVALLGQASAVMGRGRGIAVAIWLSGAAVGLFLLIYSTAKLAWVALGSSPVEDARWETLAEDVRQKLGIRRPVRLLQNRSVPFLGTWGIVSPRVLLPADAESWSDERVQMVLAHELAHIKRHDWMVQVLADAARAIYWFNPIFWLASSRLRRESEQACDDSVVRMGAGGVRYAEQLLQMTRDLRGDRGLQSPILAMAQPSHLEQRLVALLNPSLNRLAATPWAVLVVAAIAIGLTLPLAAVRSGETTQSVTSTTNSSANIVALTAVPAAAPVPEEKSAVIDRASSAAQERKAVQPKTERAAIPETLPAPVIMAEPSRRAAGGLPTPTASLPVTAPPSFVCRVTQSNLQLKTRTIAKEALGNGPWIINDDRTIWGPDQPYVANRVVNTIWMRPANTELRVSARRLDADAPVYEAGPAAPYSTDYVALGLNFPSPGCWEVTATAGDSKLTFITSVRE